MANIINKGIRTKITASGENINVGEMYTCTLYYSIKVRAFRASVTAEAKNVDGVPTCVFVFEPEDTAKLKAGEVILEIYGTNTLDQMTTIKDFAIVQGNSLYA